jgi:linoleate 8R-lipoxygenase/9,12-octadecadienoate 8-hydroperoxide 8S-isomerase
MADNTHSSNPGLLSRLGDLLQHVFGNQKAPTVYPNAPENSTKTVPTGLADDIDKLGFKDIDTLLVFLNSAVKGVTDDKTFLLEGLIQLLAKLPPASREGKKLTDGLVNDLWDSLDHPPVSSLGKKFSFREPDGSNNNIHNPTLGAANTPYARSTKPLIYQNPNPPDPTTIFDTLMVRDPAKFRPHPNKISSMMFYLATIITHDIFQTSPKDYNINLTSSYLDLSPLYGRNSDEQMAVRTGKDGLLKPDSFSSKRVLGFPPGVGAFLIMFNRFHNYVVTQLAK